jgi:hypothetical protein
MSSDLEALITELEELTARMLTITCWDQRSEFSELSASRGALCAQLMNRQDLDASAAGRIGAVVHAGNGLIAQVMAMRQSALDALAEIEVQRRFTSELGGTLASQPQPHHLDMRA